jgi:hypothetical protein
MSEAGTDVQEAYGKVLAKVWGDPSFKVQLLADPPAALATLGITVPSGMKVKVLEDTDSLTHLVLRQPPSGELSTTDLRKVVGGIPAVQIHRP